MKSAYVLVAVKRDRVPEWLYRVLCRSVRPWMVRWPLRRVLHRELTRDELIGGA